MKISLNWIKEFVDLDGISTEEIIKRFNLATAEIEGAEIKGENVSNVVFAKILSVEAHPLSQKLHILKVDDGSGEPVQVVCGAPNVKVGMITAFARVGANVFGTKISKAKLAGQESFGMCCAEDELGIGCDDNGIIDVTDDVKLGQSIKEVYPIDDVIFEIDNKSLTNRPDLWGHYGLAREFASMFNKKLKPLALDDLNDYSPLSPLSIKVNSKNCFRYSSIAVENVNAKHSPMQMKIRLNYCGMRDINLLADITNYLMLEVGQPMHAFDYKVVNGICVEDAGKGMKLLTLENEEHEIAENSVVICNTKKEPVAIAGIKGGLRASISNETNSLLLESAVFDATAIRKASIKIGLRTDSSLRYEKSLDPENTTVAIARLLYILKKIDKNIKVVSRLTDVYTYKYPSVEITTSVNYIENKIGQKIGEKRIVDILTALCFGVTKKDENLIVKVPTFRATKDVSIKEDLVEEVARVFGYDNIEPKTVEFPVEPKTQDREHILEYDVKKLLCDKFGASEVHSYIWNFDDFNKEVGIASPSYLKLMDSSNSGQSSIRSELLPTLIKMFTENKNSFDDIKIFEIGRVCVGLENGSAIENKKLAVLFASRHKTETDLYFEMKRAILSIGDVLIKNSDIVFEDNTTNEIMHPVNSCKVVFAGKEVGEMGVLHTNIRNQIEKNYKVAVLEVDFRDLCTVPAKDFNIKPVSKYQSVDLDFNFLIDKTTKYAEIEKIISKFPTKLNFEFALKDIFESAELQDKLSMTFGVTISANDRTLSGKDIEVFQSKFVEYMKQNKINLK